MPSNTISLCKFVGTINLGLLTGVSASLAVVTLPALLTLSTATTARQTLSYISSRTKTLSLCLRGVTASALFLAYILSPRRFRHPYLLYTSVFTFASGLGVDYAIAYSEGTNEQRQQLDLEAQGDEVNGEEVRQAVERMKVTEGVRAAVAGAAFAMQVVGMWGDGA
ncbi:hypothetical protein BCR34DRAFT_485616 [Clohesyomyces aquaticus]|uniref:Autophagy-related protein 33 n=1 Tax=Clohesyomyces aquaticus TaxID=1231657 RepID=A0A1Y1ZJQ7_9PLEO|nr:hypothetical protein BCR34DRAFT_485616 [Clohesyomyces aquaticus]